VTKVETNATGGLVGWRAAVCRRRCGGSGLSPDGGRLGARLRPPRHRAAHAGCRRLRDPQGGGAEVRQRRASRLANGSPTSRSAARGDFAGGNHRSRIPNDAAEQAQEEPLRRRSPEDDRTGPAGDERVHAWLQWNYGASVSLDMRSKTMDNYGKQAQQDRKRAGSRFIGRKTLTATSAEPRTHQADVALGDGAAAALGKDLERELIDYMEQNRGRVLRARRHRLVRHRPGDAHPGRVRREPAGRRPLRRGLLRGHQQPERSGAGAGRLALAGIQGFASGGLVQPASRSLPRPSLLREHAHPHGARGTRGGTTEGQRHRRCARRSAPAATAGRRPRPHCSEVPDATEEPRHRGGLPLPDDLLWATSTRGRLRWPQVLPDHRRLADPVGHPAGRAADHPGGRARHGLGDARRRSSTLRAWAAMPVAPSHGPLRTDACRWPQSSRSPSATRRSPSRPSPCWASRRDPMPTSTA
jgi:hypothetical protein